MHTSCPRPVYVFVSTAVWPSPALGTEKVDVNIINILSVCPTTEGLHDLLFLVGHKVRDILTWRPHGWLWNTSTKETHQSSTNLETTYLKNVGSFSI